MPEPDPAVTSLSLGKAAARALTKLLASDLIAGHYWRLHTQAPQAWEHEVVVGAK